MNGTNGRTTYLTQDKVNETEKRRKKQTESGYWARAVVIYRLLQITYTIWLPCNVHKAAQHFRFNIFITEWKAYFISRFASRSLALSLLTHCSLKFQCQRAPVWRRTHPKWCCRLTQLLLFRNFRIRQLQCRECVHRRHTIPFIVRCLRTHNGCWWCCWANDLWKYQNSKSLVAFNKNCNWTCALIRIPNISILSRFYISFLADSCAVGCVKSRTSGCSFCC